VALDGDDDADAPDDGLAAGAADGEGDRDGLALPLHADATRPAMARQARSEPLRGAIDGIRGLHQLGDTTLSLHQRRAAGSG
jgi:hypothetical protein